MDLKRRILEGRHICMEPAAEDHREALAQALNCDAENWSIQFMPGFGEHFGAFWSMLVDAPNRISFVVRDRVTGAVAGTSSYLDIDRSNGTLEIGSTWFRPEFRGTMVNPETKLLMLSHAFDAGAERVQFTVDSRNARSRRAMAKLGATEEGTIRRHLVTWTGHKRDSVLFSIIPEEWPAVREGLLRRLGHPAD